MLLVDGMNVIGSRPDGWWRDRPGAMAALVSALDAYAQDSGEDVTVVFDGKPVEVPDAPRVDVAFASGGRDAADREIVRRLEAASDPSALRVVTSDGALAARAEELGAEPVEDRVVEQGKVITAAGVSSGIDMALTLVARIAGDEVAQAIQLGIEYDPQPPFDSGSTSKAPREIVELVRNRAAELA